MKKESAPHARAHAREEAPPEPIITYNRTIKLTAEGHGAQIKVGHVRELLRQAHERGYGDGARVSVLDTRSSSMFGYPQVIITIADDR